MPQALTYHKKVVDFFKKQPKTWDYFASAKTKNEQLSKFKLDLLKNSYKFSEETDKEIYEKVSLAKEKLGLGNLPVQVYQAQYDEEKNASIVFIEGEAHIVFSGRITQLLNDDELLAVIAHELTHVKLYTMLGGELEIADRIITAIANNYGAEAAHFETARIFRLYTEIFCDRGSFTVLEKTEPIITSLVKIATGLEKVSYDSYVKQAEEIFSAENSLKSANITHPENFIRARAIHLWHNSPNEAEAKIVKMIEGTTNLDELDIFKQREITQFTQQFLHLFLKPKWFQSVLVLS